MKTIGKTGLPVRCEQCIKKVEEECQRQISQAQQHVQEIDLHLLSVAMQRAEISQDQRAMVYGQLRMIKREMVDKHTVADLEEWLKVNEIDFESFKQYFYDMATIKEDKK